MNSKSKNKEALPIIFDYIGPSFYLRYALENAKKFNPNSRIILLGEDVSNIPDFVEYYPISEYNKSALKFRKVYKHMSNNTESVERFCFERWFVINEFVKKHKIKKFLTCDSDVLLFENITNDFYKNYACCDVTLANKTSGGFMFVGNPKALDNYCKLTYKLFSDPKEKRIFEKFWAGYKKTGKDGGINDMMAWAEYYKRNSKKVGEITDIFDNATYDAGFLTRQNVEMDGKIKKVIFENNLPYCIEKNTSKKIRMKCLHFQGPTKFYMKYFSKGKFNLIDKIKVESMMFLRDNFSNKLNKNQLKKVKKILVKLGF